MICYQFEEKFHIQEHALNNNFRLRLNSFTENLVNKEITNALLSNAGKIEFEKKIRLII